MSIIHLNSESFNSTLESTSAPILVDFFADWCMPCKMLAPILEKVANTCGEKAIIAKLNVDEAEAVAAEYGVMSIPTMIIFKDGKETARHVGTASPAEIMNLLGI